MFKFKFAVASICFFLTSAACAFDTCAQNTLFRVGAGIYDITGPAAEEGMMGYGMLKQQTAGIHQRLWARAFIIESPCNHKRVVFVNADLGQIFQAVKQEVVRRLKEKYGNLYNDDNVLLTATHTHSGPGGYATDNFYNITTLGFNSDNFNVIVNGIITAIDRANRNLQDATIKINFGKVSGVSFNRSPQAYELNPQQERHRYTDNIDTEMTLIRFDSVTGQPIGTVNWFPLHGVSMNNKNHLISSDNKGYAEYLFEKDFNSHQGEHDFVAAFAQANAGDVTPNVYGHEGGEGLAGIRAVANAGKPQYEVAKKLYQNAAELLTGGVDYRHQFVAMDHLTVEPRFTDGKPQSTCVGAIGVSMLAGTQDGEGVGYQGVTCETVSNVIPHFICEQRTTSCQGVKPIALETGSMKPAWTPQTLPFQVIQIGNLYIAAAPFELTTMTGRRIKETMLKQLENKPHPIVTLSALANAYAGYVATFEEYQLQRYEAASTHFGPWTEAGLRQEFAWLTQNLLENNEVFPGPLPANLLDGKINFQPGVVLDDKPPFKEFGDVQQDVKTTYHPGDTVEAVFWGGHPKNNFHTQQTFLAVQRLENGQWVTLRTDNDFDTEYHWARSGMSYSLATVVWRIPEDTLPGRYRLAHFGDWKSGWTHHIYSYSGYSSAFTIL